MAPQYVQFKLDFGYTLFNAQTGLRIQSHILETSLQAYYLKHVPDSSKIYVTF